jgi:hypothetical protein
MCIATIMPRIGLAQSPASQALTAQSRTQDIRLGERGQFQGQIVNAQGRPSARAEVELWKNGQPVARSVADQHGRYQFQGLKAGVYQVLAPGTGGVLRLWQPAAAPPSAQSALLLVEGPVLRGQHPHELGCPPPGAYDGAIMRALSNPWVFSGLLAAGIAIPIALSDDDDEGEGS